MVENVYLGHDNEIALILSENSTAVDLSGVSQMTLRIGSVLISSTNGATDAILWNGGTYITGEVHFKLGESSLLTVAAPNGGMFRSPLTVYDAASTYGVVWGSIVLRVIPDVEAT